MNTPPIVSPSSASIRPFTRALDDWPQVSALLDEALALPAAARESWLTGLAVAHMPHCDTLRKLLAVQARIETDDFLVKAPRLPAAAFVGEPQAGAMLGPYRLVREIGRGGMSIVWEAHHTTLRTDLRYALKLPRLSWDNAYAARLARESEILAKLEHPHIARLHGAGVDELGRPYLAMTAIDGQPIDAFCRARALSMDERIALLLQVMTAVSYAHTRHVVHCDLKPGNILVDADGHPWLLDFGVAKLLAEDAETCGAALTAQFGRAMTLDYASPEHIRGEPQTAASDIYSMAVVAYELLTGTRPHRPKRDSAAALEEAIATTEPPLASRAACEPAARRALRGGLDVILRKALKKSPADRYATMAAFADDLQRHRSEGESLLSVSERRVKTRPI